MRPWITRVDAISAAGAGVERLADAIRAGRSLAAPVPYEAPGLRSPFAALAGAGEAEELLLRVVEAVVPAEGAGLVVATSSGAISGGFERWHRDSRGTGDRTGWRQLPTNRVAERLRLAPVATVSVACASGTSAFEIARGWLRAGLVERVVVAGVDVLSLYVHAGFAGLGALAAGAPRPFARDRDGLLLGEGAAAFLLETPGSARAAGRTPLAALLGCGLAQDGVHLTAPDRTGSGLARAATRALAEAGVSPQEVGTVSTHGTSTPFNDAMEARALASVFGGPVPLHVPKAVIGHTLGAAGALEAAAVLAFLGGAEPPPPPAVEDPDCPIVVSPSRSPRIGLSVSAAFGGVDAAIVLGPPSDDDGDVPPLGTAREIARASIAADELPLARVFPGAPPALGRVDLYTRAGIAALAEVRAALPPGAAVVLASETNCHAADLRYHAGLLEGGPKQASRLHFTYTIPGAPVAEAAILLGLKGPVHVLCDGAESAHREARRMVSEGVVPAAVALAVEAPAAPATASATVYAPGDPPWSSRPSTA